MEPNRERIEDFRRRYGYEEKEAEAAIHLREVRDRLTELYRAEGEAEGVPRLRTTLFLQSNVDPHFSALSSLLAKRVLARHYPEGWGFRPGSEEEPPE